ncbi:hypothetical protein T439DRAFT_243428 [Meredithblackwellia eburnea MCA 4105]
MKKFASLRSFSRKNTRSVDYSLDGQHHLDSDFPIALQPELTQTQQRYVLVRESVQAGKCLYSEPPLMVQDSTPTALSLQNALSNLDQNGQRAFIDLPRPPGIPPSPSGSISSLPEEHTPKKAKAKPSISSLSGAMSDSASVLFFAKKNQAKMDELLATFNAHAFTLGEDSYSGMKSGTCGRGIFLVLSRFAHSCTPSANFHWDSSKFRMVVQSLVPMDKNTLPTISLVDPFLPRVERRKILREKFGFECHCAACDRDEATIRLSDARRARVHVLFIDMPNKNPRDAIRSVEEAFDLLDEEGLMGWRGCFTYDAFQFSVACSDFSSAKVWIAKAYQAFIRERGYDSEDARLMARYMSNVASHHATGRLEKQLLSGS